MSRMETNIYGDPVAAPERNVELLLRVADAVEQGIPGVKFLMQGWAHKVFFFSASGEENICGTAGCIAYHAALLVYPESSVDEIMRAFQENNLNVVGEVAWQLGLTEEEHEALFTPLGVQWSHVTPQRAAAAIRRCAAGAPPEEFWA